MPNLRPAQNIFTVILMGDLLPREEGLTTDARQPDDLLEESINLRICMSISAVDWLVCLLGV